MKALEREARCVEMASSIFELWHQRNDLENRIEARLREPQLPVDASKHLAEIDNRLEQSFVDLETIKDKRRDIRRQAAKIPINPKQLKMRGSIKAASEQIPWIETLDEQLQLLEEQLKRQKIKSIWMFKDSKRLDYKPKSSQVPIRMVFRSFQSPPSQHWQDQRKR